MLEDPIVNEVRIAADKIFSQYDYNIHKFSLMLKEKTEELKNSGWKIVKKEDLINDEKYLCPLRRSNGEEKYNY